MSKMCEIRKLKPCSALAGKLAEDSRADFGVKNYDITSPLIIISLYGEKKENSIQFNQLCHFIFPSREIKWMVNKSLLL